MWADAEVGQDLNDSVDSKNYKKNCRKRVTLKPQ